MTVENLRRRKSVRSPESDQVQGQLEGVELLISNSTIVPDETGGSAPPDGHSSDESWIDWTPPPEKIGLQSKPAPPSPPTIVWRKLMLEQ